MKYYQHHIGDFIRDTARLTDAQCMAYLRLIWMYYETEQPLDNDHDALAFKIGADAKDVQQILKHFFFQHEEKWHHARCDKEILAFCKKSESAQKSANARWENAKAMRTHSDRNADGPLSDATHNPLPNISSSLRSEDTPPAKSPARRSRADSPLYKQPIDVSDAVWISYAAVRRAKRAPLTELAMMGNRREAAKAGITLEDALTFCCEVGWQAFNAEWWAQRQAAAPKPIARQQESFAERDAEAAMARWEEMTGEVHPNRTNGRQAPVLLAAQPQLIEGNGHE